MNRLTPLLRAEPIQNKRLYRLCKRFTIVYRCQCNDVTGYSYTFDKRFTAIQPVADNSIPCIRVNAEGKQVDYTINTDDIDKVLATLIDNGIIIPLTEDELVYMSKVRVNFLELVQQRSD